MPSLVLQAGAGTGKTHSLVELCVELLRGGLTPARLCAVTFTEKAAAELKGRLRARVDELAADAFWQAVRRDLGQAQVGTIHSLCGQVLRRHAAAAGIDPQFGQLDEAQGARMLREACESTSLKALEGALGPELQAAARRLCAEMGLRKRGEFDSGLADELALLLGKLGEKGRLPPPQAEPLDDVVESRRALVAAMQEWREAARRNSAKAAYSVPPFDPAWLDQPPGRLAQSWPQLRAASPWKARATGALADAINSAREAWEAALDADAGIRGAALARDLSLLAAQAMRLHRERKARAAALDFDDLTRLCRDLLTQHPAARAAERARIGALLIDEFQDTSATQLEVFELLGGDDVAIVGDRKQSIYDFRGADVAGAQRFAQGLLDRGAERRLLTESRRSQPALVKFGNLLFAKSLAAEEQPFDTPFTADDALTAVRPQAAPEPCAELLEVAGAGVEAEAEMVARRIESLLGTVRGGDVAILLRRFTNLEVFRRALLRRRIPHLVHRGRGFHASREVLDLKALLHVAVDPDDTLALAAVLRSPLGLLSDGALVLLAREGRLDLQRREGLAPDDADALERVARLVASLQREVDRLGPAALLEAAIAATDYVAACAGGLQGEQAAANVDKLLSLARAAEQRGEGAREFLAGLVELAEDEAREPEAAVVEERDPHAVRILTVHAAKGLEFPVVFLPECATPSQQGNADRVLVEPELFVKVRGADGDRRWSRAGRAASDLRRDRELSQSRRLLYVAVTRARDRVVLSARPARGTQETWRGFVDQVSAEAMRRGLLRVLREVPPPLPRPVERAPADPGEPGALPAVVSQHVQRVEAGLRGARPTITAPVTQLADALLCARRYRLLHELRLDERPDARLERPEHDAPATALGALAHRLLELLPMPLDPGQRRSKLERLLRLEGEDPARHAEVVDAACAFLESPLGRRMAAARPEHLRRELPFALRLERPDAELLVRGQIDALLLDEKAATVVDYKLSQQRDPEHYAAQLDAYALAAHELLQGSLPVNTGIVFLRSPGAPFAAREPAAAGDVRERLLDAAAAIARGRRSGDWPRVPQDRCRAIGCGFVKRCYE
ncbi:MAG TPA: UvrD-helicase domain-containing protein [Myxococcales bacterium]|nr:UvrD-helicase domain-containing protein [Myxococcales bacterium]